MLGDWNCTWDLTYNVPTEDILKQRASDSTYRFEYSVAHLLPAIPSDTYELKVAFPEGTSIISHRFEGLNKPNRVSTATSFSYLDFLGRPTLVFSFDDYLPRVDLDAKVIIEYSLQSSLIWIEPIYLICGLMLCFSFYLIFSKLDLSFGSEILQEAYEVDQKRRDRSIRANHTETTKQAKLTHGRKK